MLKCTVFVLFVQLCLVNCLFEGDHCNAEGQSGICRPLGQCPPLVAEVRGTGRPLPLATQTRLHALTCAVIGAKLLVCCPTSSMSDYSYNSLMSNRRGREQTAAYSTNMISGATGSAAQTVVDDDTSGPDDIQDHPNLHLLPTQCGDIDDNRIWGGQTAGLFEMPWMVILSYHSERGPAYGCGGTLINERYVLTAAHCVAYLASTVHLDGVVLGEYDVRTDPDCTDIDGDKICAPSIRNSSIEQVIAHPGFRYRTLKDDIALIRLAQPVDFSLASMKPTCLPLTNALQTESLADKNGVVAGWGITENGLQSAVLLKVDLPIVSKAECKAIYKGAFHITNKQICAGAVSNKGSCGGDSGGPLITPGVVGSSVKFVQRGIVSFGPKNCGIARFPGVYTNVAYYMNWILDHMRP